MLQAMKRIQVVGPREDLGQVVDFLYQAGTVHLEKVTELVPKEEIRLDSVRQGETTEISSVLATISAILSTLPVAADDETAQEALRASLSSMTHKEILARSHGIISTLETTTRELSAKKSELVLSVTNLNRYEKVLDIIQPVEKELPVLEGFEVTILLIQEEHRDVLELIKKERADSLGHKPEPVREGPRHHPAGREGAPRARRFRGHDPPHPAGA